MVQGHPPRPLRYPQRICRRPSAERRRISGKVGFRAGQDQAFQGFRVAEWGGDFAFDSAYLIGKLGLKSSYTQQHFQKGGLSMPNEDGEPKSACAHNGQTF